ncbi:MAG: hypothetical protein R6U94_01690 [Nitriliruptoraceae bacterium]
MDLDTPPLRSWSDVETFLLDDATRDLSVGVGPLPTLAAAIGDEVVALVTLRPFDDTGPVPALVEVLALLLPLGVDRVALRLTGRAWSTLDPIPPVGEDGDLRARVLVLVRADGRPRPCRISSQLHELQPEPTSQGWTLGAAITDAEEQPAAPLLEALGILLDRRDELQEDMTSATLVAQLGRILLLGHELALAPELAFQLTAASTG